MSSDVHRNICQLLLDRGVFSEDDLLEQLGECIDRHKHAAKRAKLTLKHDDARDRKMLHEVVDHISKQLTPLGLKVARVKSRVMGTHLLYYGIVNLDEDDGFGKQEWLSKSEQEFFYKVVAEILSSDDKEIDSVAAQNLGQDLTSTTKLTNSQACKCLERLELGQWLAKSDDGIYSLGVRTEIQRQYWSEEPTKGGGATQGARSTQEAGSSQAVQEVD
jgi:hypothetical protein